jgi:hypothetical protein
VENGHRHGGRLAPAYGRCPVSKRPENTSSLQMCPACVFGFLLTDRAERGQTAAAHGCQMFFSHSPLLLS